MKTVYYTKGFMKPLHEVDSIIYLQEGERVTINEEVFKIVWKIFNIKDSIMVYHLGPI